MRRSRPGHTARLALACVLAAGLAGSTIAAASGSSATAAPTRLCGNAPTMVDGVPYMRCDAELIPVPVSVATPVPGVRAAAVAAATACQTYFVGQGQGKSPCDILHAYGLPGPSSDSASQVIGIVDAYDDPDITSELATFDALYGIADLPACTSDSQLSCFQKLNQNGGTTPPATDDGWRTEISLDVESAHAVCPNCKILLVEANTNSFANLAAAVATAAAKGATVISNSYGAEETGIDQSIYDAYASYYDISVPMFASSGDSGWGPQFPADVPNVIAVGGTTLKTTGGTRTGETVWAGTGSGCSAYATAQPWQPMTPGWAATKCGTQRSIADVSADADPATGLIIYTTYNGEAAWWQFGGTSLSSPLIAAMYALAANGTTASHPAASAYWNTSDFFDITSGTNGSCGATACKAGAGYDGPTGVGTPHGVDGFAPEDTTPVVGSFTPLSGLAGMKVTLTGTFIGDATAVSLGAESASFMPLSATQLKVTIPSGATDDTFTVTTPDGTSTSGGTFVVGTIPAIAGFSPTKGVEGATVTVRGTNLADVSDVELNGTPAAVVGTPTATSLKFTVPSPATSGQIAVTNAHATVTSGGSFSITPTIDTVAPFTPSTGIVGSTFDVTGTGFNGVTTGKVGSRAATVVVNSDTSVTVTVPVTATTGKVSLTGPGGTATSKVLFTVLPPPLVASLSPTRAVEGATVTVHGKYLTNTSSVTLNGVALLAYTFVSDTALTFVVPPDAHSGPVGVTTPNGTTTSTKSFAITPTIDTVAPFTPTSGAVLSTFGVTGTGFNGVTTGKVGSKPATVVVNSDTSVTVTVPDGATTGKVSLTGPGGTATSKSTFTVTHTDRVLSRADPLAARLLGVTTTRLAIDVWPAGRTIAAGHRHYTLACAPARGTVPHAGRACAALAALSAPFAPVAQGTICPALTLGPQEARVTGLVHGARVHAWLNLRGCGIARWNRVRAVVPQPTGRRSP